MDTRLKTYMVAYRKTAFMHEVILEDFIDKKEAVAFMEGKGDEIEVVFHGEYLRYHEFGKSVIGTKG